MLHLSLGTELQTSHCRIIVWYALQWLDPIELHGIGQYASDAYFMFCRGNWQDVEPTDKDLLKYQRWLRSTGGEGTGLERDVMPIVSMEDIGPGPELNV